MERRAAVVTAGPSPSYIVRAAAGIDERHVLLIDNSWSLIEDATRETIREFGGFMVLGNGQLVPMKGSAE